MIFDFDVYPHTLGTLGAEEKDIVTCDIFQNDVATAKSQIKDLNDYLSYLIKRKQIQIKYTPGIGVINYGSEALIEESNAAENLARIKIKYFRVLTMLTLPIHIRQAAAHMRCIYISTVKAGLYIILL